MDRKDDCLKVSSVKEMMEQMGFKKDAPVSTQEAFLKHLVKSANRNVNLIQFCKPVRVQDEAQQQLDLFDKAS